MDDIVAPPTATQDAIPALADDLLKDRIRQFLEFLDDEVSRCAMIGEQLLIPRVAVPSARVQLSGCRQAHVGQG